MSKKEKSKLSRCRYCHRSFIKNENSKCLVNGWEKDRVKEITTEICENCDKFDSRYIEYPLTIHGINNHKINNLELGQECGSLCEIQPCNEEYEGKSYLGIYLGNLPVSIYSSFDRNTKILENATMSNPAIYVPELKKIIYGCESWWRKIDSLEDFKGISKEDIEETWYVKLLKEMSKKL